MPQSRGKEPRAKSKIEGLGTIDGGCDSAQTTSTLPNFQHLSRGGVACVRFLVHARLRCGLLSNRHVLGDDALASTPLFCCQLGV